jgi:hypothetical protein
MTRNIGAGYSVRDFRAELDTFDLDDEQRTVLEDLRAQLLGLDEPEPDEPDTLSHLPDLELPDW